MEWQLAAVQFDWPLEIQPAFYDFLLSLRRQFADVINFRVHDWLASDVEITVAAQSL